MSEPGAATNYVRSSSDCPFPAEPLHNNVWWFDWLVQIATFVIREGSYDEAFLVCYGRGSVSLFGVR